MMVSSDSLQAMNVVRNGELLGNRILVQGRELKDIVQHVFMMSYVPRELNKEADSLAKCGLAQNNLVEYWM